MLEGALVSWAGMAQEAEGAVHNLRQLLNNALVASEPRMEKECWNAVVTMWQTPDTFEHVLRWYTQDVIAALLFVGVDSLSGLDACRLIPQAPPSTSASPYVSATERELASSLMCSIVFRNTFSELSTSRLIGGIFPLMGSLVAPAKAKGDDIPLRASIARSLFGRHKRFEARRVICGTLLDTLLFGRPDGLQGVLLAVLLSDGVDRGELVEAILQLIPLLIRSTPPSILVVSGSGWSPRKLSLDEYHQTVCTQLVGLLGHVSENDSAEVSRKQTPFQRVQPSETVEERLHLFLVMALNRIVHLPSPTIDPKAFQVAYRWFHSANKHLFGRGFGALLMHSPKDTASVERALFNLLCLLKGSSGCASQESLLMLWEKCCAGLLAASSAIVRGIGAAWASSTSPTVVCVMSIWKYTAMLPLCTTEICAAICAAFTQAEHKSLVGHWQGAVGGVSFESRATDEACMSGEELVALIMLHPAPKLSREMFRSLCLATQQRIFGTKDHRDLKRLVRALHLLLVSLDVHDLFDVDRIDLTISTLNIALTLGPIMCRASSGLLQQMLSSFTPAQFERRMCEDVTALLCATKQLLSDEQRMIISADLFGDSSGAEPISSSLAHTIDKAIEQLGSCAASEEGSARSTVRSSIDVMPEVTAMERHMTTGNVALLAVSAMRLSSAIDNAWRSRRPIVNHPDIMAVLLRCLMTSEDVGVLGHVVTIASRLLLIGVVTPDDWAAVLQHAVLDEPVAGSRLLTFVVPRLQRGIWDQFVARIFDVQLAVCDDDREGVFSKTLEKICKEKSHGGIVDIIATIAANTAKPLFLRMSALHLIGHVAAAVSPLVPIPWLVEMATTCFRLSVEEPCKSAAAAMLSTLVMSLRSRPSEALSPSDVGSLLSIAKHLSQYRGNAALPPSSHLAWRQHLRTEEEVIRFHGELIQRELKEMTQEAFGVSTQEPNSEFARLTTSSWKEQDASLRAVSRLLRL